MATNEETNAAGTDTRPPMLVENDYESWKIRIHRYIRGKPNGKLIWKSIQNGPTPHPMVIDPPPTNSTIMPAPRKKLDSEFNEEENKLKMADTQAEIILSQGLPRHIFNILNQTSTAKEIWDNVELLMQGSGRTLQQRKEDLFDKYEHFCAIGNKLIHDYFMRFHKLVNDMKINQLNIPTHQMNTKFVNNLPAYWGNIVDPLAYVAHTTSTPALPSPSTSSSQPTAQSSNDALMATMTQIANLLSGFQKQFPPTNNQLRTSSNSRTHATVHDGHIVTEPVQRKAPGNVGNTGARGKKVICYNCRGEGHVARQCKEPKRKMDSQYFKDKALLMEAKEKGDVLDAEAEAFLADVECTAPYDQPQALTTTNMFQANHEDAYDSDVDEGPNAAVAFMANLSSTSATNNPVNEVHSNDNQIFDNVDYQLNQEMHQEEHLDSDAETEIDDNTIPYHQYLLDTEAQNVPTEVSADTSDKVSMIAILTDLQTQLDGHAKVNQEKCLEIETLKNELLQCKQEICRLDTHKVKLDLENKVRQEQALVIQRNKRNAELVQENDLLKSTLSGKEKSIAFLQSEKEKILSEKKDLADSYLDEIVCLKNANKVARDMLQRFNMPTQTIPMLSKKPKKATDDLHKDILGTRNPGLGYIAKRAQPVLYDADTFLHPAHHPVSIWDSEEWSIKELSQEQAYWLSANEIASNASNPATPVTPFVHKSRPPSQVLANLQKVNAVFHQFEGIIKERTTQKPDYVSEWCYDYAKQFVEQQLVPFYDHFKKHIQAANDTLFKEVKEYEQIFDDLEAEYEQCVLDNKNLTIEKKNLLIKNDCLIAECLEKDICSIVLTFDIVVPPSSNCLCKDLRSACDREHTKVLELEAEVLKQQKMVIESEKRNSHLQKTHIDLQLKFQNYKQCIDTSSASNAIFEINKLRDQLQGKDTTIRNLDAQINIMKVLNVGSTTGSCDQQALETDRIQLKDTITSLRIQLDGLKVENVSLKRRYDELSKANTHSRTAYTEKINALTAENAKLKTELSGKKSSGSTAFEKPKVLASGMYTISSKYIPPPKRGNWVKPTPLPKKKQVTFQETPRTSNRPTQKPPVQQNKKPNVPVNLSTRTKPATKSRKPMPKSHTRNHRILPSTSVNARRAADHNRKLNVVDHNQFVVRSLTSVQTSSGLAPQRMTSVPNSTELELTALQSGRSRSALVKDPEPPSVPPTKKQVDDLFQWFDDDEVVPIPPVVPITPVNVPAAPAPRMPHVHLPQQLSQKALLQLLKASYLIKYLYQTLMYGILVPCLDNYLNIPLNDFQNKLDEYGDVLTNKAPVSAKVSSEAGISILRNPLLRCYTLEARSDSSLLTARAAEYETWSLPAWTASLANVYLTQERALYGLNKLRLRGCHRTLRNTSGSAQFHDIRLLAGTSKKQYKYCHLHNRAEYIALIRMLCSNPTGCCSTLALPSTLEIRHHYRKKRRFATLLPLLGVKQMSPETLKELQDESVSESKGRIVADSIAERLTRPTVHKFKTDCSIIPVWYCYVYLLKSKDEAIDKFILYKTKVKNQLGKKIKVVRSDRGGEYVALFAELCAKHGIRHEFTASYSP
ncbi:retrovirus-related pol polyprotein from transposon TNT 1-94 [Tanacetum coccineum]